MIGTPTVFVIGAGASAPYHFPLGPGLVERMVGVADMAAMTDAGFPVDDWHNFRNELRKSGMLSIDKFLAHRTDLKDIGKSAIAAALLPFEKTATLFNVSNKGNWLRHLCNQMEMHPDRIATNRVSFVTFNYDRCIEDYLCTSMRSLSRASDADCRSALGQLEIIHIYGSLGDFDPAHPLHVPFNSEPTKANIEKARESIRVVPEGEKAPDRSKRAVELLKQADRVIFLGYSFGADSLRLISPVLWQRGGTQNTWACVFGLLDAEQNGVRKKFPSGINLGHPGHDALGFLRQYIEL